MRLLWAMDCVLLCIESPTLDLGFQFGTGLVRGTLECSSNLQVVGCVRCGCTGTPGKHDVFRKRFTGVGGRRWIDAELRVQLLQLVPQHLTPRRWPGPVGLDGIGLLSSTCSVVIAPGYAWY